MRLFLLTVVFTLVALASSIADTRLDKHWKLWKSLYEKKYESVQDELTRRLIWEDNLKMINLHNLEHSLGMHTFTLDMNVYGDMTHAEFIQRNGFHQPKDKMISGMKFKEHHPDPNAKLPDTLDWRTKGCVTNVKDQGQCGSCWSFSTTGSLECQYFKSSGTLVAFSEQQLVDCSGSFGTEGCNGGWMDFAFRYIQKNGIESETDYPYNAQENTCAYDASKVVTKISSIVDITSGSESALQDAVANQGPVSVAIDASHSSFQFYSTGVYNEPECGHDEDQLDHAVLVIGYGQEDGQDYWLVKNSWTSSWGEEGYIKMTRNKDNQCGISTVASYPQI